MEHHVGIDVSLELSSVCVLDTAGKVIRETKVASEPGSLVAFLRGLGVMIVRVGLKAGPLSQWLYDGLQAAGYETVLLETRHVKAALSAMASVDPSPKHPRDTSTAKPHAPTSQAPVSSPEQRTHLERGASYSMNWRSRADHGQKHETGDWMHSELDDQGPITEAAEPKFRLSYARPVGAGWPVSGSYSCSGLPSGWYLPPCCCAS